eukprot:SAG22_NODE_1456_length_4385_cov_12.667289_8_plen_70_part_00
MPHHRWPGYEVPSAIAAPSMPRSFMQWYRHSLSMQNIWRSVYPTWAANPSNVLLWGMWQYDCPWAQQLC